MFPWPGLMGCFTWINLALACSTLVGCNKGVTEPANPGYVQVYSFSPSRDGAHPVEMYDEDGKKWFREKQPAFDLRAFRFEEALVGEAPDGSYLVYLPLKKSYERRFARWTRDQIGQPVGIVVGGKLRAVSKVVGMGRGGVSITGYKSMDKAVHVMNLIRFGGQVPWLSSQPAEGLKGRKGR